MKHNSKIPMPLRFLSTTIISLALLHTFVKYCLIRNRGNYILFLVGTKTCHLTDYQIYFLQTSRSPSRNLEQQNDLHCFKNIGKYKCNQKKRRHYTKLIKRYTYIMHTKTTTEKNLNYTKHCSLNTSINVTYSHIYIL
ncbi:hypothetical protein LSH36_581g03005 [Paralvinella palmiformis]|uniref:Uncharacterized protein n=1 Tax=Paralvinella palmiformis TaxID=53620 RepID=A0AAD9MVE8_9ANNE|nr:hypothetical protein LSH36_581g03005 [Paralvinella palmiformis]